MDSARKAAEGVLNQEDVSAKEKQAQIKRIYNKAGLKKEKGGFRIISPNLSSSNLASIVCT